MTDWTTPDGPSEALLINPDGTSQSQALYGPHPRRYGFDKFGWRQWDLGHKAEDGRLYFVQPGAETPNPRASQEAGVELHGPVIVMPTVLNFGLQYPSVGL